MIVTDQVVGWFTGGSDGVSDSSLKLPVRFLFDSVSSYLYGRKIAVSVSISTELN